MSKLRRSHEAKAILLAHVGFLAGFLLVAWWSDGAGRAWGMVEPSRSSYQPEEDGDWICPISNEETETANKTFAKIAAVLTNQPRCVNCHGGVVPFAAEAEDTHGGGRQEILFRLEGSETVQDFQGTFNQCQACHSAFPGRWRIPNTELSFKGKTADQLCLQMHEQFQIADSFVDHIEHDKDPENPFLQEGFKGTRGLNEAGQALVDGEYRLEPPVGVTHANLLAWAQQWVKDVGGEFGNTLECGCVPLQYGLLIKMQTTVTGAQGAGTYRADGSAAFTMPLKVEVDGSVSGEAQATYMYTSTLTSPDGGCVTRAAIPGRWTATGKIDSSLELKFTATTSEARGTSECTLGGQSVTQPFTIPGDASGSNSPPKAFELHTFVGEVQPFSVPVPNGTGKYEITVVRLD